jgi:hypothetical protein
MSGMPTTRTRMRPFAPRVTRLGRGKRRILENAESGPLLHGDRRKKIHGPQVNRKPSQARLTFAGRVGSRVR